MNLEIKIDFFHDVFCVWCYIASPRLRKAIEQFNGNIEINHRCFALAPDQDDITRMFGGPVQGKEEILRHWQSAKDHSNNEVEINVGLMRERTFPYPHSLPGLIACKAAELQGGQELHWKFLDRVQYTHAAICRNIADRQVLFDLATELKLDMVQFEKDFQNDSKKEKVSKDFELDRLMSVNAVPTVVINQKIKIPGAVSTEDYLKIFNEQFNKQIYKEKYNGYTRYVFV